MLLVSLSTDTEGRDIADFSFTVANANRDGSTTWICQDCSKKVKTRNERLNVGRSIGESVNQTDNPLHHDSHEALPQNVSRRLFNREVTTRSATSGHSAQAVRTAALLAVPLAHRHALPRPSSTRRQVNRKREIDGLPPLPETLAAVDIPLLLRSTIDNDLFLLFDSGPDDVRRLFIFVTPQFLQLLAECAHYIGDGTFKFVSF